MARCGCSSSGCACDVIGSETFCIDIDVDGDGSFDDPYEITASLNLNATDGTLLCSPAGLTAHTFINDSGCIHVVGSGTELNPYVIGNFPFTVQDLATFAVSGELSAPTVGTLRFRFPFPANLQAVSAAVNTAPSGADIVLDVNLNGVSITTGTPPTILDGAFDTGVSEFAFDVQNVVAGDYLQVDIDQVGSIVPGSDLTVFIRYSWSGVECID